MNNLADLYWNQGRYDEAEPLYLETLETRKRVLGDDHPDTLNSMNNLANLYQISRAATPRPSRSTSKCLETQKRVLGDDHPAHARIHEQPGRPVLEPGPLRRGRTALPRIPRNTQSACSETTTRTRSAP